MPYTNSQLRCLEGMGLVPWVLREHAEAKVTRATSDEGLAVAVDSAITADVITTEAVTADLAPQSAVTSTSEPVSLLDAVLFGVPFRGKLVETLGNPDAPLLIVVEATSTSQQQYPFETVDAKLFDDMLRAISWRRQDTCLAVIQSGGSQLDVTIEKQSTVGDLVKNHRDAVLVFRQAMPETEDADKLRIDIERPHMPAWQLPHPALLRSSPARKRQAWNVLKAARASLT